MKHFILLILSLFAVSVAQNTCENKVCPNGQVCQLQDGPCYNGVCQFQAVCVENPCNLVDCIPNTQCKLVEVVCVRPPCNPQPRCVNSTTQLFVDPCQNVSCPAGLYCGRSIGRYGAECFDPCVRANCPANRACRVVNVQCFAPPCPPIGECYDPCEGKVCESYQVCRVNEVVCKRPPCNPVAECVDSDDASSEHPGTCPPPSGLAGTCIFDPARNCLSDVTCRRDQKCCPEGCGRVCKSVTTEVNPCSFTLCTVGSICVSVPDPTCSTPPCPPIGRCQAPVVTQQTNPCITVKCSQGFECRVQIGITGNGISAVCKKIDNSVSPCEIGKPVLRRNSARAVFCGRGPSRRNCPRGTRCIIEPADRYAVCCIDPPPGTLPYPRG